MFINPVLAAAALSLLPFNAFAAQDLPAEIAAPGETEVLSAHATGAQIYECMLNDDGTRSWTFREPVANLVVNGQTVGHHFPGPSWQMADGSSVKGKVAAKVAGATADDIPWLRLDVINHAGKGQFDNVTTVQRLNTIGGVLKGECQTAGVQTAVPYSADYVFLTKCH